MKKLIAILSMLALFAAAGSTGAQDKDKAPEKPAAEAPKAEPAKAEAKAEEKKAEAKPAPTPAPTKGKT